MSGEEGGGGGVWNNPGLSLSAVLLFCRFRADCFARKFFSFLDLLMSDFRQYSFSAPVPPELIHSPSLDFGMLSFCGRFGAMGVLGAESNSSSSDVTELLRKRCEGWSREERDALFHFETCRSLLLSVEGYWIYTDNDAVRRGVVETQMKCLKLVDSILRTSRKPAHMLDSIHACLRMMTSEACWHAFVLWELPDGRHGRDGRVDMVELNARFIEELVWIANNVPRLAFVKGE